MTQSWSGGKRVVAALYMAMSLGCFADRPTIDRVRGDFGQIVVAEAGCECEPVIHDVGPGEGDTDNVYMHLRFDLKPRHSITPSGGWLSGVPLRAGETLREGEIILLYQRAGNSGEWRLASHHVTSIPRRP